MAVRHDKFQPGDEVQWAQRLRGQGEWVSDGAAGPFRIAAVRDVEFSPGRAQSNWQSMGHTQLVTVEGLTEEWSGAYFEKIEADAEPAPSPIGLEDDAKALASAGMVEEP